MPSENNLQELFHDTLKDIYFAEKKILSALPKMAKAAQSEDLKAAFQNRLFAAPRNSHSEQALHDVDDLTKPIRDELEKFFMATDELENKKLKIIGWKGPKAAVQAIKDATKSFAKDGN